MRNQILRILFGPDVAEFLRGYRPPEGKHNSLITGSPISWSWGKGDHGLELDGLEDDDHTQYLNTTRHDLTERHALGTVVPHDNLADLLEKAHASLTGVGPDDHHAKYTDVEAQNTVKTNVEVGDLKAPTKALDMASQKITSLPTPTTGSEPATKDFVDSLVQGLDWQESVLDELADPPGTPVTGDRYLVIAAATGDWVEHENDIAEWDDTGWVFTTPNTGFAVWIEDVGSQKVYNGTVWVAFGTTVDHGNLIGLGDDDHTQYLNNARHDLTARHPLSVLDPAVCSETEADGKITTHKGNASAHHTKTTTAAGITSGRFPVDRLPAMTDEKIWKGTGGNVEEIDVPSGVPDAETGDHLKASDDDEKSTSSTVFIKAKEIKIGRGGTLRIKFDIRDATGANHSRGAVYRNGGIVGATWVGSSDYSTKSEDIAGWSAGDLCQLYYKTTSSSYGCMVRNFRIYVNNPML